MHHLPHATSGQCRLQEARRLVGDLLAPRPVVYWADFLSSLGVAWIATRGSLVAPTGSVMAVAWGALAAVAILRVAAFRREIARLRAGEMTAFTYGWNLLAGIPLLQPAFRLPLAAGHRPHGQHRAGTLARRVATAWAVPGMPWAFVMLLVAGPVRLAGVDAGRRTPLVLLAIAGTVMLLDLVRVTVARRRRTAGTGGMPAADVIAERNVDSLLLEPLLPVGQRYAALQRLMPALPYHTLGSAHRRILEALPDWHGYRAATWPAPAACESTPRSVETAGPGVRRAG